MFEHPISQSEALSSSLFWYNTQFNYDLLNHLPLETEKPYLYTSPYYESQPLLSDYSPSPSFGSSDYFESPQHSASSSFRSPSPCSSPEPVKEKRGRRKLTIEKTFPCDVNGCHKVFGRQEHVKRHIRSIHTREKPFVCPYRNCQKKFARSDNLNQHIRTHRKSGK